MDKVFKVMADDGQEKELKVYKPTAQSQKEAQKVRNKAFSEAIASKAILRDELQKVLTERGIWTDDKENTFNTLKQEIVTLEHRLETGGLYLDEAREIALKMRSLRNDMRKMLIERTMLDSETAEGQAENMAFNYLVYANTYLVYNNVESRYFRSLDDYLDKSTSTEAYQAASALTELMSGGLNVDSQAHLTENKFLKDYGFVDDKMRLINEDSHLIDEEGRLINEDGRFIDKDGNFVDSSGRPVDKEGNFVITRKPFLTRDGKEVEPVVVKKNEQDAERQADSKPTDSAS